MTINPVTVAVAFPGLEVSVFAVSNTMTGRCVRVTGTADIVSPLVRRDNGQTDNLGGQNAFAKVEGLTCGSEN